MISCHTYVCLISKQSDPNLFLLFKAPVYPKRIVMVVSKPMKAAAEYFKQALLAHEIEIVELEPEIEHDILKLQERFTELLRSEAIPEKPKEFDVSVAANITGGTKPMSIALYVACRREGVLSYYLSGNNILYSISPDLNGGQNRESLLVESLNLKEFRRYVLAHGYTFNSIEDNTLASSDARNEFMEFAVKHPDVVYQLNTLASKASGQVNHRNSVLNPWISVDSYVQTRSPQLRELLKICQGKNLVEDYGTDKVRFHKDALHFVNGAWFEEWIQQRIQKAIPNIFRNLEICNEDGIKNEFDVLFFHNSRTYVIEAKTVKWSTKNDNENDLQNVIHKLNVLTEKVGGINAKAAIVSLFTLTEPMKKRAKEAGIKIIEANALRPDSAFIGYINKWIS